MSSSFNRRFDLVRGMQNVPVVPIKITSVTLLKGDKLVK